MRAQTDVSYYTEDISNVSTVALLKYMLPGNPMPGCDVSPFLPTSLRELGKGRDPNGLKLGLYNFHGMGT